MLSACIPSIVGRPDGAPAGACTTFEPSHGVGVISQPMDISPFRIIIDTPYQRWSANEKINGKLTYVLS